MLKHLRIQNIILVEQADIPFSVGLNVLTGETGSGKSAIMNGISLAIGERTDTGIIRKGCDKGTVEAIFDIDSHPLLLSLLAEAGIDHELGQELIIRREVPLNGKSRVFINHQLAQVSFLRQLGTNLVQIVGQHANQTLFSLDHHRHLLDLFGGLEENLKSFQTHFNHENHLRKELETWIQNEAQRLREIDICQRELEELEEARLKEGEEEELFSEYTILTNAKELSEKVYEINQALSGERQSVLTHMNRQRANFDSIARIDAGLSDSFQAFQNAFLELQEIVHTLSHYQNRLQNDPDRLQFLNERLSLINRLKRKYGATIEEIQGYYTQTKSKLEQLENADVQIEELQEQLKAAEEATNRSAQELSDLRRQNALQLQNALTNQLRSLNMSKAVFTVQVTDQRRSLSGQDKIEFFLQPNFGENSIALKDGASGGEIARVMLALQTLLAGKERTPTLIFDEVDANIGGETAAIIGDKLKDISQQHQVICITHFPQVASQAFHHLQISKQEKEGRTVTLVRSLDSHTKQQELARMVGTKPVTKSARTAKKVPA